MKAKAISTLLFSGSLLMAGCVAAPKEATSSSTAPATTASTAPASSEIAVGHDAPAPSAGAAAPASQGASPGGAPVKWSAPARWEAKPASGMRAATYIVPAAKGDAEGAELAVFANNLGGGVQANIDRWIGQFEASDAPKAKQKKETINGFPITSVDLTGTFKGGGMAMGQTSGPKSGYRLLGAIVETPGGEVFFKMTGPIKTMDAAQAEFQGLLKSLK
ncbi:MAG: hypothetical protein SF339_21260 [Blastocatellia bacterium]|nr:hypothetical protein [Blastocatellia bacterium]